MKCMSLLAETCTDNAMQISMEAISLTLKAVPPTTDCLIVFSVNLHLITQKAVLIGGEKKRVPSKAYYVLSPVGA